MSLKTMSHDDVLAALGRVAAEQERPCAAELEALARGELDEEARRDLERRAADDPQLALAVEAFRPLDGATKARIAAAVVETLGVSTDEGDLSAPREPAEPTASAATVVDLSLVRRRRRFVGVAVPLAAAAALVAWLAGSSVLRESVQVLPRYGLSATGGERELRGAEGRTRPSAPTIVLGPDSRLRVLLRPSTPAGSEVDARAFLVAEDGLRPLDLALEKAPSGALRLSGAAKLFGAATGTHELRIVVARPAVLAASARELASAASHVGRGWQRFSLRVTLRGNEPPAPCVAEGECAIPPPRGK